MNPTETFGSTLSGVRPLSPIVFETNLDRFDRVLRGTAGVWLLAVAVSAVRSDRTEL